MSATSLFVNCKARYSAGDIYSVCGKLSAIARAARLATSLFAQAPDIGTLLEVTLNGWRKDLTEIRLPIVTGWIEENIGEEHYENACKLFFADLTTAELAFATLRSKPVDGKSYSYNGEACRWDAQTTV